MVYVLLENGKTLGVWASVSKLCSDNEQIEGFPSFWTISRKTHQLQTEGVTEFESNDGKHYKIECVGFHKTVRENKTTPIPPTIGAIKD